jgi:hypothetical protein
MKSLNYLFSFALSLLVIERAVAFGSGSGGCQTGMAAVGGLHLDDSNGRTVTSGVLRDYGVNVSMNDALLDPLYAETRLEINATYTIKVTAPEGKMEGCLIRFEAQTSKDIFIFEPVENVVEATACADFPNAIGLTHFNDEYKTVCSADIVITETEPILIEVTIVLSNDRDGPSVFAYNSFSTETFVTVNPEGTEPSVSPVTADSPVVAPITADSPAVSPVTADSPVAPTDDSTLNPSVVGSGVSSDIASDTASDSSSDLGSDESSNSSLSPVTADSPVALAPVAPGSPTVMPAMSPVTAPVPAAPSADRGIPTSEPVPLSMGTVTTSSSVSFILGGIIFFLLR